jgi:hypothetical protein
MRTISTRSQNGESYHLIPIGDLTDAVIALNWRRSKVRFIRSEGRRKWRNVTNKVEPRKPQHLNIKSCRNRMRKNEKVLAEEMVYVLGYVIYGVGGSFQTCSRSHGTIVEHLRLTFATLSYAISFCMSTVSGGISPPARDSPRIVILYCR